MDKTTEVINARKPKTGARVMEAIGSRFSPRFYTGEPVPIGDMDIIFEAARWAPSSYNIQPWSYYYTENGSEMFVKLLAALSQSNQWARTAGNLIVACYQVKTEKGINYSAKYDLGLSVMSLVLQARTLGYHARQMGGIDREKIKEMLHLPENETPHTVIALGTLGDYEKADEDILKRDMTPTARKTDLARKI